jgi:excisionase family DNA binding protein
MMNASINLDTRLLRASEVAKILNISRPLAYRLMQTGKIPTVRINSSVRVRLEDLEGFIQSNRTFA